MLPKAIKPMLARLGEPFDSPQHLYEIKWDGTRCLVFIEAGEIRLQNRRLRDITYRYPEFWNLPKLFKEDGLVLDGEIVVLREGRPVFQLLQEREHVVSPLKIKALAQHLPATYMVFDLLYFRGESLMKRPLCERREILRSVLPETPFVVESRYVLKKGKAFFQEVVSLGFEGVMAKDLESPYLPGKRTDYWLKFKPRQKRTCVVVGYLLRPDGTLKSLLVAEATPKGLVYRGRVGTGFNDEQARFLLEKLKTLVQSEPVPLRGLLPKDALWVRPELWVEISFQELTHRGQFRAPVLEKILGALM